MASFEIDDADFEALGLTVEQTVQEKGARSWADIYDESSEDPQTWGSFTVEESGLVIPNAPSTVRRIYLLMVDFSRFHDSQEKWQGPALAKVNLGNRILEYLTWIVIKSKSHKSPARPPGQPLGFRSLETYRSDLRSMVVHKSSPPFSADELALFDIRCRQHMFWLKDHYDLSIASSYKRAVLGKGDLRLILEGILKVEDRPTAIEIQDALLHLVHYFTACRPGSILTTKQYSSFIPLVHCFTACHPGPILTTKQLERHPTTAKI